MKKGFIRTVIFMAILALGSTMFTGCKDKAQTDSIRAYQEKKKRASEAFRTPVKQSASTSSTGK